MMKRKSAIGGWLAVFIAGIFLTVSCMDKNSAKTKTESGQDKQLQDNEVSTQTGHPRVDTVFIKLMKFQPAEIYVNRGDTIVWMNEGLVEHDVTRFPDKSWTSDTIARGASWKMMVEEGFDYFCSIHITMKGKVKINP